MPPFSDDDLWSAWERVRENEGCAGADGVTVHIFAQRAHRLIPDLQVLATSVGAQLVPAQLRQRVDPGSTRVVRAIVAAKASPPRWLATRVAGREMLRRAEQRRSG